MGPISKFLGETTSAVYRKPSSFKTDNQQHKSLGMEFHVKIGAVDQFPPAIRQTLRCVKAVRPIRSVRLDLWEENFTFNVQTGAVGTKGDEYAFNGCDGKALRIFRDKDNVIWLAFQVKAGSTKANSSFTAVNYGEEVRVSAEGQPELPGTVVSEADDDQKDLAFDEVEAQNPRRRVAKKEKSAKPEKKKGARSGKPGKALPRQLGTGPKLSKRKK